MPTQNVPFYEKAGFKLKEVQMVLYKVMQILVHPAAFAHSYTG